MQKNNNVYPEVVTSSIMIVEILNLSFEVDERFPWIKVYKIDEAWQKKEFITEIDEDNTPIFVDSEEGFGELKKYCLEWFLRNAKTILSKKGC